MFVKNRIGNRARKRTSLTAGWLLGTLTCAGVYFASQPVTFAANGQNRPAEVLLTQNVEIAQSNPDAGGNGVTEQTGASNQDPSVATSDDTSESGGLFSANNLLILGILGAIFALIVVRRRNSETWEAVGDEPVQTAQALSGRNFPRAEPVAPGRAPVKSVNKSERRLAEVPPAKTFPARVAAAALVNSGSDSETALTKSDKGSSQRLTNPVNVTVFGAYRVVQEAEKLVTGQPHRVEVLASRAPDDRAAVENALMSTLEDKSLDEAAHTRAVRALNDYGFVARRCAALLLAANSEERVATARVLGTVGAPSALPFLLEALYDYDEKVRLQAVVSLGELKLPGAIGALLDLARRHPEVPSGLLQQALNACSVDTSLDFLNVPRTPLLLDDEWDDEEWVPQTPIIGAEDLPVGDGDVGVPDALSQLETATTAEERSNVANLLGLYPSQRSIATLTYLAGSDPSPSVRSNAVMGLAEINHVSVFTPILLAVGDEAREVRACAARALSRLDFERSDAYVRLAQTVDAGMLRLVAQACIRAGMAAQAIDRLASADQRLSHEAYTLLSLLVQAQEIAPITEAIQNHESYETRVAAVRLLGSANDRHTADALRGLAISDGMTERLRTEILESLIKMDSNRGRSENTGDNFAARVA